ncbi:hypothetical protein GOODEAATRI_026566 [Goodea atripinnis]|uniref:Uncharacterized protein n=1 Tax=Goodea atripinnis TaxID=208336 RepID=A0ABV0NZW4_9TELE
MKRTQEPPDQLGPQVPRCAPTLPTLSWLPNLVAVTDTRPTPPIPTTRPRTTRTPPPPSGAQAAHHLEHGQTGVPAWGTPATAKSINRSSKKSQVIHGPPLPEPPRGGNTITTGTIYIPTLPKDNVNPSGNGSTTPIPIFKTMTLPVNDAKLCKGVIFINDRGQVEGYWLKSTKCQKEQV